VGDDDLRGTAQLASGSFDLCARTGTGRARCWGDNTYGQLGVGTTGPTGISAAVRNMAGTAELLRVTSVAAGLRFSCASLTNGQARCWGTNALNQLGNGGGGGQSLPVVVSLA